MEKQEFTIAELNEHLNSHNDSFRQTVYKRLAIGILSGKMNYSYDDFFFMEDNNNCYNGAPEGKITARLDSLLQAMLCDKYVATDSNLINFINFTSSCNKHNLVAEYFLQTLGILSPAGRTLLAGKLIKFPKLDAKLETRIFISALLNREFTLAAAREKNISMQDNFSELLNDYVCIHDQSLFLSSYYEITSLIANSKGPANFCASINYLDTYQDFFPSHKAFVELFDAALQNYVQSSKELYPTQTKNLLAFCNNENIDDSIKFRLWKALFETDKLSQLDNEEIDKAFHSFYRYTNSLEELSLFFSCLSKHINLSIANIEESQYKDISAILGPKVKLAASMAADKVHFLCKKLETAAHQEQYLQQLLICLDFLTTLAKEYGSYILCEKNRGIFNILIDLHRIDHNLVNDEVLGKHKLTERRFALAEIICKNSSSYDFDFLKMIKDYYPNCLEAFRYMKLNWITFFRFMNDLATDKNGIECKIMKDIIYQLEKDNRTDYREIDHILANQSFNLDGLPKKLQQRIDEIRETRKKQQEFLSRFQ